MTNLTIKEQDYIIKDINYDLKISKIEKKEWENSLRITTDGQYKKQLKTWIAEHEERIEFLTNLINKF